MLFGAKTRSGQSGPIKTTILLWLGVVFFFAPLSQHIYGQKKFSRNFPAGQNVRLQLLNRSGTVTVEGWNRPQVSISASLEAPAANISPQQVEGTIFINLVKDNQGREIGNVNFTIRVPHTSSVDIETLIGNLNVSNIRGGLVRAHISGIGDLFFDGEFLAGGNYRFTSMRGAINLRIPFNSSFKMVATAPSTRNISLGSFTNNSLNYLSDGRRVVGKFGDGDSTLTVTNQRGSIAFLRR